MIDYKATKKTIKEVEKQLLEIKGDALKSASQAMDDTATKLLELSRDKVPVITGNLKGSGKTKTRDLKSFTSFNTDYASKVDDRRGYLSGVYNNNKKQLQDFANERFNKYFF